WYATVRPKDGQNFGTLNTSSTITVLNTPPHVSSVILSPSNPVTTQQLTVTNTTTDSDGDPITSYEIRWYNPSLNSSYTNFSTIPADQTRKGEIWWCQVIAFDGTNLSSWTTSNSVTIENSAPSASDLTITPSNPLTGHTLIAGYNFSDADMDSESGSLIRWYKNGALQGNLNDSLTVNSSLTAKGENWYFTIVPSDGTDNGTQKQSSTITIQNSAPTVSDLEILPNDPKTGNDLTANYNFSDVDSDAESGSKIIWYKNGVLQGSLNDSSPVSASYTTEGDVWHYKLQPSDGTDFGNWVNCPMNITIDNSEPIASSLVITPSSPITTNSLTATYDWADNDTTDTESGTLIRWYKDGILQINLNDSLTVGSGNTTKGDVWHFKVQPSDGTVYGSWVSCPLNITIGNSAPSVSGLSITPSSPNTENDLSAVYTYQDTDNDSESSSIIRWYKNGMLQGSLNDSLTVDSSFTAKGENWYFTIIPSDGTDNGTQKQSSTITIQNSAPTATDLEIIPDSAKTNNDFSANYTFTDADSDVESGSNIIWYKNGVLQGSLNDSTTVSASYTAKGEEWHFKILPSDGTSYGDWTSCLINVTIGNSAPSTSNLAITPNNPTTADSLTATYDWADNDTSDTESGTLIRWYKNGFLQPTLNNSLVIGAGNTTKNDVWHFKVQPSDSFDFGDWFSCPVNVTIGNTPPEVSNVKINETSPVAVDADLHVVYIYYDYDGDNQDNDSREIRWYKDGNLIPALNDSVIVSAGNTSEGDFWYFTIRVSDGSNLSTLETSPSVSIVTQANQLPIASNLNFTNLNPTTTDYLYINWTYSDADSDPKSGSMYYWYRNGVHMGQYDGLQNLSSSATAKGEVWHVKVKPRDGIDFGVLVGIPNNVTIGNTAPTASNLDISPSSPKTGHDLSASYTFSDIDSDPESGSKIIWYKDGILQGALNNSFSVQAGNTSKGEEWHFKIQPKDGTDFGSWIGSQTNITIGNTAPSVDNLEVTPSDVKTGNDLTANYDFADVDSIDTESGSEIRWFKNNLLQVDLNDTTTVSSSLTTKGELWYFTIEPRDGSDFGTKRISAAVTILNTAPIVNNLLLTPSTPVTSDLLHANYNWTDADTSDLELGSEILWYRDNQLIGELNGLSMVGPSYTAKGQEWHFKIRPADGINLGVWVSCPTNITIGNTAPEASNVQITPSDAKTGNDLTAFYDWLDNDTTDTDNDSLIYWYLNRTGAFILQPAHTNQSTVPTAATLKGDQWLFSIVPNDGENTGTAVNSSALLIQNSVPTVTNPIITPVDPITGNDLTASYTWMDSDTGDSDTASRIYWYKNGQLQGAYNDTLLVPSSQTAKGENWYFTVKPGDSEGWGTLKISTLITIGNTAPSVSNLVFSPTEPKATDDLTISYDWADDDTSDSESGTIIRWYLEGVLQSSYNDLKTIDSTLLIKGNLWNVSIKASDGTDFNTIWTNSSINIGNSAPSMTTANIDTTNPRTTDNLEISYAALDLDSDNITLFSIEWLLGVSPQATYNN
ncbi:MAG: hypothetical protein ACXACB_07385, partial [Promethearchaeota archaeon]